MQVFNGKSVFGGIAIGKIYVYQKGEQQVRRTRITDIPKERTDIGRPPLLPWSS